MVLQLEQLLSLQQGISLAEASKVALQNRVDSKFLLHTSQLIEFLTACSSDYAVLDILGRLPRYRSLYFDSDALDLYFQHHNGYAKRYKLRSRSYVDSQRHFLEFKEKLRERTIKQRISTERFVDNLASYPQGQPWLRSRTAHTSTAWHPQLYSHYRRICLIGKNQQERLTVDVELSCSHLSTSIAWEDLAIVELKQAKANLTSPARQALRAMGVRRSSFSKYCMGLASLNSSLKQNHFKASFLQLEKLGIDSRTAPISC